MAKFYLSKNASRPVVTGGKTFIFEAAEFFPATGSWWGILAAEDSADAALLDEAVSQKLILEISPEDFEALTLKKNKTSASSNLITFHGKLPPQSVAFSGKPVEVVGEHDAPPPKNPAAAQAEALVDVLAAQAPTKPAIRSKK